MKNQTEKCVLIIVGPTASGKTDLSLRIAVRTRGEIVSADSRQIFTFMDIGTAKPTPAEMAIVRHHMINIRNPDELFNAGMYGLLGRKIVGEIHQRNYLPIVVGGSGLYIQSLVEGIFTGDYRDRKIREKLCKQADEQGLSGLYEQLQRIDPEAVQRIHANDRKRIIRALEVYTLSGEPISHIQKNKTRSADFKAEYWGLRWPREELYHRINSRVDRMVHDGLLDEVAHLREMGYGPELNSLDSVGYKETFLYLDGILTLEQMIDLIKRNTRRYAKKQLNWFRRNSNIHWIDLESPVDWDSITDHILKIIHCF
jgi:tRNA dimethylallyltransferase